MLGKTETSELAAQLGLTSMSTDGAILPPLAWALPLPHCPARQGAPGAAQGIQDIPGGTMTAAGRYIGGIALDEGHTGSVERRIFLG